MQTDLFLKKRDQLKMFCLRKSHISKAEIIEWGINNYYISADRVVRKWVEQKIAKRLTKEEIKRKGIKNKAGMAWYSFTGR